MTWGLWPSRGSCSWFLAVIGARAVLAGKVFVEQDGLHRLELRIKMQRFTREAGHKLKHQGILHGLRGVPTPGEGTMAGHQDRGVVPRIKVLEALDDDLAGIGFVISLDFPWGKQARARHFAIPIVSLGRAIGGNAFARLGPGGGIKAVRVNDAVNLLEGAVEHEVRGSVGTGLTIG